MAYKELRARFGLTAQAAVRTISKVADAFKVSRDAAPVFRADAAQPYDDRILRFVQDGNAVSLWTLEGRITNRRLPRRSCTKASKQPAASQRWVCW